MLLKIGSKNDDVKAVQTKLGLPADGVFGPNTEQAVNDWQQSNGLVVDGVVGDATWCKMFGVISAKDENGHFVDEHGNPVVIASADDKHLATSEADVTASVAGLDLQKLKGAIPDAVIALIPDCAEKFEINTPLRLAHFIAQCGHESGGFKATQENLNYSADGLNKTFGEYFPDNLADSYARQPEKIASRVYANRMGNGDEASKEGYTYRGRGYIQLTGKDNYKAFDKSVDADVTNSPDLVASQYALLSAAWYWDSRAINAVADGGSSDDVVTAVTKKVNGGTIGLDDRISHFKTYYALLS